MLLRSAAVRAELSADRVARLAEDADEWSAAGGFPFTDRPAGGFSESPAFNDAALMEVIGTSYEVALSWVWGERPKLEDCIETVRLHARQVHSSLSRCSVYGCRLKDLKRGLLPPNR